VIGGLLTSTSNVLIERRRDARDEKRNTERDEREVREAARLVLEELAEIDEALQQAIVSGYTWPADRQLPAFAWREYGAVLAVHLPPAAWRWIGAAYSSANKANWHVIQLQREDETEDSVEYGHNDWLREPFRTVRQAMEELETAVGRTSGVYAYTGHISVGDLEKEVFDDPDPPFGQQSGSD